MPYKNILVATAFSDKCDRTLDHAKTIAAAHQATLHLVHFVEPLPACAFSYAGATLIDEQRVKSAKEKLALVGKAMGIAPENRHLDEALPRAGIINLAKKLHVDLIIVGRHGHNPMVTVLGATADAIAHHSPCDVLIVK